MVKPTWIADIDIDVPLAYRLIAAQFPKLRGKKVEPFGLGWDNAAFLIDGRVLFRFPRRRAVAGLIEREIAILPTIASQLPTPISAPTFLGAPSAEFPWAFAGYGLIAGNTACSLELSDASRTALAAPLALFLRALHGIEAAPLVKRGLPPDEIGRLDHDKRLPLTRERLATLVGSGVDDEAGRATDWLEAHPPTPLDESKRGLVHGDLYARHVLLERSAHLAGVIDWGDVHFGDPAIDIAIAHLMLPSSAHAAFRDAYGPIDERTWTVARYRAIYHAILELDYGIREGDAGMRQIGSTALRLITGFLTR